MFPAASDDTLLQASGPSIDHVDIRDAAEKGSPPAMWMVLLHKLAESTGDPRRDVSIGAIQTIFRILGSSADQLPTSLWDYSFREGFLRMLQIDLVRCNEAVISSTNMPRRRDLHSVTQALLESLADFFSTQTHIFIALDAFLIHWKAMIELLGSYLAFEDRHLQALVFDCLSISLTNFQQSEVIQQQAIDAVLAMWINKMPAKQEPMEPEALDKALTAYVRLGAHLRSLGESRLEKSHVQAIVINLARSVDMCPLPPYTSDNDSMTDLQAAILDMLLRLDAPDLPSVIIKQLASFAELPFREPLTSSGHRQPSFIAFAKKAHTSIQALVVSSASSTSIYTSGAVSAALAALATAVDARYTSSKQGKSPPLWRSATSVASAITQLILPLHIMNLDRDVQNELWSKLVDFTAYIRESNVNHLPEDDVLIEDETFDLAILVQMRNAFGIHLIKEPSRTLGSSGLDDRSIEQNIRKSIGDCHCLIS